MGTNTSFFFCIEACLALNSVKCATLSMSGYEM